MAQCIWYHLKVLKTTFCLFTFPFRQVSIKKQASTDSFFYFIARTTCEHIFSFPSGAGIGFWRDLTACSSTPPDQRPSDQTAPGPLLARFCRQKKRRISMLNTICIPDTRCGSVESFPDYPACQPDFVVGPAGTQGVTHTTIQRR